MTLFGVDSAYLNLKNQLNKKKINEGFDYYFDLDKK